MAIQMINGYVAVSNQEQINGLMKGTVALIAPDVVSVKAGDVVFYSQAETKSTRQGTAEYIIVHASKIMGKL